MKPHESDKVILFRCALNSASGLGHLKRCIEIAKSLSNYFVPLFIIPQNSDKISNILNKNNLLFHSISSRLGLSEEITFYPNNVVGIVLDLTDDFYRERPKNFYQFLDKISEQSIPIVVLEGMFEDRILIKNHPSIRLIIQPYVGAERDSKLLDVPTLAGSKYVIVSSAYLPSKTLKLKDHHRVNILITLGGSDPQEVTTWVLESLKTDLTNVVKYNISVVIGPNFSTRQIKNIKACSKWFPNIKLIYNPDNLASIYHSADVALLGSGASSRYEAAACGVPVIGVSILRIHDRQCLLNSGTGGYNYLGFYKDINSKYYCERIIKLLVDEKRYKKLAKDALNLIDGRGAHRIASRIENEFTEET